MASARGSGAHDHNRDHDRAETRDAADKQNSSFKYLKYKNSKQKSGAFQYITVLFMIGYFLKLHAGPDGVFRRAR